MQNKTPCLNTVVSDMQSCIEALTSELSSTKRTIELLIKENIDQKNEIKNINSVINNQVALIADLEHELDGIGQFNRRSNVVFSNIRTSADVPAKTQIMELCNEIGVNVYDSSLISCHEQPSKTANKDSCIVARFKEVGIVRKIFRNRRKAKTIGTSKKAKLARDEKRGFGISPHLTVKRSKLFAQVKDFNKQYNFGGCWVDPNNGKIYLRVPDTDRGQEIKSTSDLVTMISAFQPECWYFCQAPTAINAASKPRKPTSLPETVEPNLPRPAELCSTCNINESILACSFCERYFCINCTRQCDSCYETFCEPLCSVVNYEEKTDRSFCLSCNLNCSKP